MASISHPSSKSSVVVGCGGISLDLLATVAAFPKPDDKIRSMSFKVQGGGNVGNSLTCAARLGLKPRIVSKIAADSNGQLILEELEVDGVDTSFLVVSKEGNSPFTYVIVDNETRTRTCINTPGNPPVNVEDIGNMRLSSALDGAKMVYLDGRLHEIAIPLAQEAARKKIPILIGVERKREGLDHLLSLADYVICSARFPQSWTGAPSISSGLLSMVLGSPNIKFVIVTCGEDGCIMLDRNINCEENANADVMDIGDLLESLKQTKDENVTVPTCLSLRAVKMTTDGIGTLYGNLWFCTAEKIPPSELVDTTGAGDSFVGAVLYALCKEMRPEKMLPFAATVAAAGCRALGARTALPSLSDPRLAPFLS